MKFQLVGENNDLDKVLLNRIVRWRRGRGVACEVDLRHAEVIMNDMGVKEKTASSSAVAGQVLQIVTSERERQRVRHGHQKKLLET